MVPRCRGAAPRQSPGQLGAYKMCRVYIKHLLTVLVYTRYTRDKPEPEHELEIRKKCVRNSAKFRVRLSRLKAHIKIEKPCWHNIFYMHIYSSIVCACVCVLII